MCVYIHPFNTAVETLSKGRRISIVYFTRKNWWVMTDDVKSQLEENP